MNNYNYNKTATLDFGTIHNSKSTINGQEDMPDCWLFFYWEDWTEKRSELWLFGASPVSHTATQGTILWSN